MRLTNKSLLPALALAGGLAACSGGNSDAPAATPSEALSNADAPQFVAQATDGIGSVDFAISGRTVGANQDQCELSFTVTNNSREEMKNLYTEFAVSDAASGAVLRADQPLVVPGSIPPGQRKSPFGPSYVNLACASVQLTPRDPINSACRENCVPYLYTASGIAGLQ